MVNVFEGARRIALRGQDVIWLGVAAAVYWGPQSVYVSFETAGPDQPFRLTSADCSGLENARDWLYGVKMPGGEEANVSLCFRAMEFPGGKRYVPHRAADGMVYGSDVYSTEVMNYTKARAASFAVAPTDEDRVREFVRSRKWELWRENAATAVKVGAVLSGILFVFTLITGWIVRGFLGIERGQDRRAPKAVSGADGSG